jgi:hypothetical protein
MSSGGRLAITCLAACTLACCGGGGDDRLFDLGGDFAVVNVDVAGGVEVPLNATIVMRFTDDVSRSSVTAGTIVVRAAAPGGDLVPGAFRVDGDVVEFRPRLPSRPDLADTGLQPDGRYVVELVATGSKGVRSTGGERLYRPVRAEFTTAGAASPSLFVDEQPAAPPRVVWILPPGGSDDVPVTTHVEVRFSEPLHPSTVTTDTCALLNIKLSPPRRVPGRLELDQSDAFSVRLRFVPDRDLRGGSIYQFVVTTGVEDLVGNDCEPFVQSFSTGGAFPLATLGLEFGPDDDALRDDAATTAAWNTDVPGQLSAVFTGSGTSVGRSVWIWCGCEEPVFLYPEAEDFVSWIPKSGQEIRAEVQLAREDPANPGEPDPSTASAWTHRNAIQSLNDLGYSFVRMRITFTLPADQTVADPLPSVDRLAVRFLE